MNKLLVSLLRAVALASALLAIPALATAKDSPVTDPAAQQLANIGIIPVKAAGPYVQVGSYRIHVEVRLGRPSATLPDGTWLYHNFIAENSETAGTLVVRFKQGRVCQLSLVSRAVELAMLTPPVKNSGAFANK